MFKVTAYGKVARYVGEGVEMHVPHHTSGWQDPVVVRVDRDRRIIKRRQFPPGSTLHVTGDAYQYRDNGLIYLAIKPTSASEKPPITTRNRHCALWCIAHGSISTRVETDVIRDSLGSAKTSCSFQVHVQVPEMTDGLHVVLRCRQVADDPRPLVREAERLEDVVRRLAAPDAEAVERARHDLERARSAADEAVSIDNDVRFLSRHVKGNRINMEGELLEYRFRDAGGVPRTAHQLIIRRWGYAQDRDRRRAGVA